MKVKEESEKVGLKLNSQKTKIMASGPITSWQIDGEMVETVTDFVFLEFSWFLNDPTDVGNLISGSFTFSKYSLYIWKFQVHVLLNTNLENFEHYFGSM